MRRPQPPIASPVIHTPLAQDFGGQMKLPRAWLAIQPDG
jgi:hypothetical protein